MSGDKKGLFFFLKIFLIVLAVLVVAGIIAGIYFYNYHVFKTVRVCVSNTNVTNTGISCTNNQDCLQKVKDAGILGEMQEITDYPDFLDVKIKEVFDNAFVCEETCKIKKTCGDAFGEPCENQESCKVGEKEITLEIHGSELWALAKFAKNHPEFLSS